MLFEHFRISRTSFVHGHFPRSWSMRLTMMARPSSSGENSRNLAVERRYRDWVLSWGFTQWRSCNNPFLQGTLWRLEVEDVGMSLWALFYTPSSFKLWHWRSPSPKISKVVGQLGLGAVVLCKNNSMGIEMSEQLVCPVIGGYLQGSLVSQEKFP